jgi:lipoprotein NlpI
VTWLCLASVRQNKDCKAAIQPYLSDISEDRWPGPAIQYLLGKKTLDSMMGAAKADTAAPQEVADAYFFSAEKQLVGNARADAMTNFRHVGEIDGFANPERVLAERELSNPQSAASP